MWKTSATRGDFSSEFYNIYIYVSKTLYGIITGNTFYRDNHMHIEDLQDLCQLPRSVTSYSSIVRFHLLLTWRHEDGIVCDLGIYTVWLPRSGVRFHQDGWMGLCLMSHCVSSGVLSKCINIGVGVMHGRKNYLAPGSYGELRACYVYNVPSGRFEHTSFKQMHREKEFSHLKD